MRHGDGSAGDVNYGQIGAGYTSYRQPEPAIASLILQALGGAASVLNVGAGAGSYEPTDRQVTAVEPSASMRQQRPRHLVKAIDATAESLPFPDKSFDAAMATFTVHQWSNLEAGLAEMRRVSRGPVVILNCNPDEVQRFWLNDYAPDVLATEARRYPSTKRLEAGIGTPLTVIPVPIPLHCKDGFNEAYYGRPEMLLDPDARRANSAWSFVSPETAASCVSHLQSDLADGRWDDRYGHFRTAPSFEGSLFLYVSER